MISISESGLSGIDIDKYPSYDWFDAFMDKHTLDKSMKNMELKALRDKCLLFNEFMVEGGYFPNELAEAFKDSNLLIEAAYKDGKIKPLKSMSNDIDSQVIRHMPLAMVLKLKAFCKEKLDINFEAVDKARIKMIEKILKKGKISNPEEYGLVLSRIDEIYSEPSKSEEMKHLNELLLAFDMQKNS